MTRLVWGAVGARTYEAGVDRGVLYVNNLGVPWNGLKSIAENPSGGSPKPFYLDGIKYLNISETEEFEGTIEAFSAPAEFGPCDGSQSIYAGLIATQQPRKSFGLSYRTMSGDDVTALGGYYKIHIIYGALAQPANRSRSTISASTDPVTLSWAITTTPPVTALIRPTAHIIVDTRTAPPSVVSSIEDILYGTSPTTARLPLPSELVSIFAAYANPNLLPLAAMKNASDATLWTAATGTVANTAISKSGGSGISMIGATASLPTITPTTPATTAPVVVGQTYTALASLNAASAGKSAHVRLVWYNSSNAIISSVNATALPLSVGSWLQSAVTAVAPAGATHAGVAVIADTALTTPDYIAVDEIGIFNGTYLVWSP